MNDPRNIALPIMLAVLSALSFSSCRSHREGEDRFSEVRSEIIDFLEDENVPSISVAVAQHGRIIWEESFGWANREKQIKASPNTMYELASIAKVYTTTGLMVLMERGLIDIDAPVGQYLGDVKITTFGMDASGITLRRIVQHTSGLPMYWGEPSSGDSNRRYSRSDILNRYGILAFKPGERELYSNLGISTLIHVLEEVSGQPYDTFLRNEVLDPLGLKTTKRFVAPVPIEECARQYDHAGNPWTNSEGFYASVHDLVRFGMFHLKDRLPDQKRILSDSTLDLMQTSIDPHSDFRLPWWVWEYEGFYALVFTGASGTILALVPEADVAIAVLANRLQANTPKICRLIAECLLDDFDERQRRPTRIHTQKKIQSGSLSPRSLTGVWRGSIMTPGNLLRVEVSFSTVGFPQMRNMNNDGTWGSWVETMPALRGSYTGGIFSAYFPIQIPIVDTRGHDHWTWVYAGVKGDTLQGYAVAHAAGGPHFGLPYYIRLVR